MKRTKDSKDDCHLSSNKQKAYYKLLNWCPHTEWCCLESNKVKLKKAKAKHLNRLLLSLGALKNLLMLFGFPSFASSSTSSIFLFADFELPPIFAILNCGLN